MHTPKLHVNILGDERLLPITFRPLIVHEILTQYAGRHGYRLTLTSDYVAVTIIPQDVH